LYSAGLSQIVEKILSPDYELLSRDTAALALKSNSVRKAEEKATYLHGAIMSYAREDPALMNEYARNLLEFMQNEMKVSGGEKTEGEGGEGAPSA
jgi:hypothetical protein